MLKFADATAAAGEAGARKLSSKVQAGFQRMLKLADASAFARLGG